MEQVEAGVRPRAEMESIQLHVNGFCFDGLAAGPKTGELVLFLHGFPQFAEAWHAVMEPVAAAGYRVVAVNQRGYSAGARPGTVEAYGAVELSSDVLGFADALRAERFHLVGHDWGGVVGWRVAAAHPERVLSLTAVSMPHPDAFLEALEKDEDQRSRSKYILLFRAPAGMAETALLAINARGLRKAYAGKLPAAEVEANVRRFAEDGALRAALNWYRALDRKARIGEIKVPTLYIWGEDDRALGEAAALGTVRFVKGPYRFERLVGKSHWLLEEAPETVARLLTEQLKETPA
jgi:pimeloyl-ACP methyl ester carboxylesterase